MPRCCQAHVFVLLLAAACAQAQTASDLVQQFIQEPVFWKQIEIGKQIVAQRDPAVFQTLRPLLADRSRSVRTNAAFIFAKLGDPLGIRTVIDIVNDRSPDRVLTPPAAPGLNSPTAQIQQDRYYAVHVLGEIGDPAGIPTLLTLWNDPDLNYAIPWSLSQIGGPEAVRALIGALSGPVPEIRAFASEGLGRLKAQDALPMLNNLLQDASPLHLGKIPTVAEYAREAINAIQSK